MGLVVGVLNLPPALGLLHGGGHGGGDGVGVEDHQALRVPGGPADGLDEGGLRAEEPLLVGVQNGHQGDFWQVQPLPEEVDAHQHVEGPRRRSRMISMRSMVSTSWCMYRTRMPAPWR